MRRVLICQWTAVASTITVSEPVQWEGVGGGVGTDISYRECLSKYLGPAGGRWSDPALVSWSWRGLHLDLLPLQARQLLGHIDTAPRQGRDGVTTLAPILLAERDAGSVLIHLAPAPWHDDCELDLISTGECGEKVWTSQLCYIGKLTVMWD